MSRLTFYEKIFKKYLQVSSAAIVTGPKKIKSAYNNIYIALHKILIDWDFTAQSTH